MSFKIKYYGSRGSIPVSGTRYNEFGGSTTCVLVELTDHTIIIDAGTGVRQLGNDLMASGFGSKEGKTVSMLFTHTHWDHIQGFPFFIPAYLPQNKIQIYGESKKVTVSDSDSREVWDIEKTMKGQQQFMYFPVSMDNMAASFSFHPIGPDHPVTIGDVKISALRMNHPNTTLGFRFDFENKAFVFATDVEHSDAMVDALIEFSKDADIFAFDCQYFPDEYEAGKQGWGHSTYEYGIKICEEANVPTLHMIHHDPTHDDDRLKEMESLAQESFKNSIMIKELSEYSL